MPKTIKPTAGLPKHLKPYEAEPLAGNYKVAPDELVMFLDESGDSSLGDPSHPVFVLSACMALGGSMDAVADAWRAVRLAIMGDEESKLHFADIGRRMSRGSREKTLADFFDQ